MGSLMAGWSSHALDDDSKVRFMRNRSLTKEEVEAFRRQHTKPAPDQDGGETLVASSSPSGRSTPPRPSTLSHVRSSPPAMTTTSSSMGGDGEAAASPSTSRDWWTRSSWAFLNEPPPPLQQRDGGGVGQGAATAV